MIAFLGSTIGNLEPPARAAFPASRRRAAPAGDMFLLGTDLVKDTGRLLRAYDDSAGVTAEFNRNVLKVVNRELVPTSTSSSSSTWRSGTPGGSG